MKIILTIALLLTTSIHAKDYILNFERSCYERYGPMVRDRIISRAISNWNTMPFTPRLFVRGEDLLFEVDRLNYKELLWSPLEEPTGPHRDLNPIVCDSDNSIQQDMNSNNWFPWSESEHLINGFAARYKTTDQTHYDYFALYISEGHTLDQPTLYLWWDYQTTSRIRQGSWTEDEAVSLLTHELGHIINVPHNKIIQPSGPQYPIMWPNNFNISGQLQIEDIFLFKQAVPNSYLGMDKGISFEAKIEQNKAVTFDGYAFNVNNQDIKISVSVNIPHRLVRFNAIFLSLAIIDQDYYILQDQKWHEYTPGDELIGDSINSGYQFNSIIYTGHWQFSGLVTVYFGVKIDNEIYYNFETPMRILN